MQQLGPKIDCERMMSLYIVYIINITISGSQCCIVCYYNYMHMSVVSNKSIKVCRHNSLTTELSLFRSLQQFVALFVNSWTIIL